jgi:hypothetical protein
MLAYSVLAGCSGGSEDSSSAHLERYVSKNPTGRGGDVWLEMKIVTGEWEKTGLIFGYLDDYEECLKALEGLKKLTTPASIAALQL